MTIKDALFKATAQLKTANIGSAKLDAELLLAHTLQTRREYILAHSEQELLKHQLSIFEDLVSQRLNRTPLVHLTGLREFYSLEFEITPDVLTPRIETEQMVEWAIEYTPQNSSMIDVGTGSGAIAIAIAIHRPDLDIWASEIDTSALSVAQRNASKHKVKVTFTRSNLFKEVPKRFSTIVTNLPYLKQDADLMPEVTKEPAVALFGGTDGLELYRQFFLQIPAHLEAYGHVFTECDPWQQPELTLLASKAGLKLIEQGYFILGFQLK
jgi:release factor glutamine methyltransferase